MGDYWGAASLNRNSSSSTQTTPVAQTNSVVGTWKVARIMDAYGSYTLTEWGMSMVEAQLGDTFDRNSAEYQMAMEMITEAFDSIAYEFKENGTIVISASAAGQTSTQTGTYQISGTQVTFTLDGQTAVLDFDPVSNTLSVSQEGMTLIMTKQ